MRIILLLIIVAAIAGYFTNPTAEAHRTAANAILHEQADDAAQNLDLGGLLETGAASLGQQGDYQTYYVASKYTLSAGDRPYIECWGAFTQVMCRRTGQGEMQPGRSN